MLFDLEAILKHQPQLDRQTTEHRLAQFTQAYFDQFDHAQIAEHLYQASQLTNDQPVHVQMTQVDEQTATCTVIAYDHPFEFSMITGCLAARGFSIQCGSVFTLHPPTGTSPENAPGLTPGLTPRNFPEKQASHKHPSRGRLGSAVLRRAQQAKPHAVILDHFIGQADFGSSYANWATRTEQLLHEVLTLLAKRDDDSATKAKQRVNAQMTRRMNTQKTHAQVPAINPMQMDIDRQENGSARIRITAEDTPAFLYAMSTALSVQNLSIEQVHIQNVGNQVQDEIIVTDTKNRARQGKLKTQTIDRIRLSVLLTKQFAHFLDHAPDPLRALTRFEQMVGEILEAPQSGQWVDMLSNPKAMAEFARLLGASDFLWEECIRTQYDSVLPLFKPHLQEGKPFCEPAQTLPARLEQALKGAVGLPQQQDRLNKFKDHELFLIDLDHILTPGWDMRELSSRLNLLAENLVATACDLVFEDLARSYGKPANNASYAIFGLGKLGGIALGYASDIELLFVYPGQGKTAGGKRGRINHSEFYERFVKETAAFLRTKREGIFEVDLRLRPHGKDGPQAVSVDQFDQYYAPDGPAHPFERLALVRMRWIGGDPLLGSKVERLRNNYLYDGKPLNHDALWELLGRARKEKNRPGQFNAKYSPGALTDLEFVVQLLQVEHAKHIPQLRTPRLREVLGSLRRANVLSATEYEQLYSAYIFLRQLINGLRMLRGSAKDLFLPKLDSDDLAHLSQRIGYEWDGDTSPAQQLIAQWETQTATVRNFVQKTFGRPCPGMETS